MPNLKTDVDCFNIDKSLDGKDRRSGIQTSNPFSPYSHSECQHSNRSQRLAGRS